MAQLMQKSVKANCEKNDCADERKGTRKSGAIVCNFVANAGRKR
jgi:hypothetical protein